MSIDWITPDWDAPRGVRAISTTRAGGVSQGSYATLNLGDHVGDDPTAVRQNRERLMQALGLAIEPGWLTQVHGTEVLQLGSRAGCGRQADASISREPDRACVIMTADCLPVLFCDRDASVVAAAHAGWRGLAAGVLERTVKQMDVPPDRLMAWLGPAIGPAVFEVGDEVKQAFENKMAEATACFRPSPAGRWFADIYALAHLRLRQCGVESVQGGGMCTYSEADRFFSYRRDRQTGRMASLIWLSGA